MSRPDLDEDEIARVAAQHGLVAVVGAGLSTGHPSALPGWNAINDAFIDSLAMKLAEHTGGEVGFQFAEFVLERRETAEAAQPDLQAQLAEEAMGEQYFSLFAPLDIEAWNDGHAALAAIAQTGHLRAIVTTNFDRLIECALAAAGVRHEVFCAPEDFERLAQQLDDPAAAAEAGLPVIKVHGSVERRATMVDTLRQRVLGRPKSLERALLHLYSKHAVLLAGFSGGDLAYDPQYLGLRAGAAASPSFTVICRSTSKPRPALAELVAAAPRAAIVNGELPQSLVRLSSALGARGLLVTPGWDPEDTTPGIRMAALRSDVYFALKDSISPVKAAVVLARIAEIAGSTDAAQQLLTKSMKHHIKEKLVTDPAMPEHIGMIASNLIEAGRITADESELSALQVFKVKGVRLTTDSLAQAALANALIGAAIQSDAAGLQALRESREDFRPTVRADTVCALARSWTLAEKWTQPHVECLRQAYELMYNWGDEVRKARVGALYIRFLVANQDLDRAHEVLVQSADVVRRLNLPVVGNDLAAAAGRLYFAAHRYDEALRALLSACKHHEESQHFLRLAETLLPLSEAAAAAGDAETLKRARASFDSLLPLMPGLALPDAASRVRMLCRAGNTVEAAKVVDDLRALDESWGNNVWIAPLAERLEAEVSRSATGGSPAH